ncbi:helix-turn-helix domain-containing protein [Streptomyces sp. NBC_01571]|uniref:helix-turn-helix domain-containing protein n=1 Tax=Streptomyces sp. NBC_01571 TaxID=2975883 RepID=UPI002B1CABFE|nr:helix-turn-helix domain-containing protein [Streptomyces sp. NBC_01571]
MTDQEGQKLQQIVRRGSTSSVRFRRAMMLLASAGGNRVPVIAQLVQADEDTVRDVIHRFNEIGLACLDPRWAGGRPRLLSTNDEFTIANSDHRNHTVQTRALQSHLRWRNMNARHPDVLAAQRRERARIRSEKGIGWGGRPLAEAA